MKRGMLIFFAAIGRLAASACAACQRNQPRILRGITHGGGPESKWDYWIVGSMMAVVLLTLIFSVKWLIRPGEKGASHIKRVILNPTFL